MNIYFVRHGQSEGNVAQVVQTEHENLTERGKAQAFSLAERLENTPIDAMIASSYVRARQTAEIISGHLGLSVEEDPLLGEMRYPSELQGLGYFTEAKNTLDTLFENYHDPEFRYSDEETFEDLKKRGQKVLEKLKGRSEENILVVTHGTFIKLLVGFMLIGDDMDSYQFGRLRRTLLTCNTGITLCEYRTSEKDRENQGWRFWTYSDYEHLQKKNLA